MAPRPPGEANPNDKIQMAKGQWAAGRGIAVSEIAISGQRVV
ncbi:MAG: hypothetical protein ACLFVD_04415 [Dehalococcoidia bacterium]